MQRYQRSTSPDNAKPTPRPLLSQGYHLKKIARSLKGLADEVFVDVEIIPGPGFEWDPTSRSLKGRVPARALGASEPAERRKGAPPEIREQLERMRLSLKK